MERQPIADFIFRQLDFEEVNRSLNELSSLDEQIDFLAREYPSLATIAVMTDFPGHEELLARIQQANARILANASNAPGAAHGLRYQPQTAFSSLGEALVMNSSVLTPATLERICKDTIVHGGAKCYVFLQFCCTNQGNGPPRSIHADVAYYPENAEDGAPWFISSYIHPNERPGGKAVFEEFFGSVTSADLPSSAFELTQAKQQPDNKLGGCNIVHWDDMTKTERSFPDTMSKISGTTKVTYHTTGVMAFNLDQEAYREAKIVQSIISESLKLGVMPGLGAHVGMNSCVHFAASIHSRIFGPAIRLLPLDEVLYRMMDSAESLYWTHTRELRMKDFFDNPSRFTKSTAASFKGLLKAAFASKPIHSTISADRVPYAAQYLDFSCLPKDNPEAATVLFGKILDIMAAYLENRI